MIFDILTIFPQLLNSPLDESIIRRARLSRKISTNIINIRDFAEGAHAMTDDRPFGGGEGMVMKPEPLVLAVESRKNTFRQRKSKVILLSPQGKGYTQETAGRLATESHLILVCGRYEGVDERFRAGYIDEEISIGDFILTGGELAAMIIVDSVTRLLPGVLGCSDSAEKDTFSRNLLKHPQYTRPRVFKGSEVPEELLSGNHKKIEEYRFIAAVTRTLDRRPELFKKTIFTDIEKKMLRQYKLYDAVLKIQADTVKNDISG